jgi:hypothetical protein
MSRAVRRVPNDWQHPKDERGRYRPMFDRGFATDLAEWDNEDPDERENSRPCEHDYMPVWSDAERTHFQMYEETSEGTPISPVMETPEALARWLVDNNASAFGGSTATYEAWLRIAQGGWAPSMIMQHGVFMSGVEALTTTATQVGDAVQFKQQTGTYPGLRLGLAERTRSSEHVVLGEGQLSWNGSERRSDRYGAVGLYSDADWKVCANSQPLHCQIYSGTRGVLRAVVLETQDADHCGDLTHGWHVGGAKVGDVYELGEGVLFFDHEGGEKVGVRPEDGRDTLWLDGPNLYKCHSQTVRLEFVPFVVGSAS